MGPSHLDDARAAHRDTGERYHELLRTSTMSVGLYALPAGATDEQTPHAEDEVYHVLAGRAALEVGDERHPVAPGAVMYVERGVDHRFVDVEDDLEVLVVFAPPEGTLADDD